MDNAIYQKMIDGMCTTYRDDFGLLSVQMQDDIRSQMIKLFNNNIEPTLGLLFSKVDVVFDEVNTGSETAIENISLIKKLSAKDAEIINIGFNTSQRIGVAAFVNSTQSFEGYLREKSCGTPFIRGLSIEWRTYLIELLLHIETQYHDIVVPKVLFS